MSGGFVHMGYAMDLKQITIQAYREILKIQNLLPGRRCLLDGLDEKFMSMADAGIDNLFALKSSLSTSDRLSALTKKTNIPEEYLVILKRELNSLDQKPVPISDFPGVSEQTVRSLSACKIKTSKDLYNLIETTGEAEAICASTGIGKSELDELYALCNLVRINGVGAAAARTLYESGKIL